MALLPTAPEGIPHLAQVAAAPLRGCCRLHLELVSNRYAAAVDWALLQARAGHRHPAREVVQRICDHLQGMDTGWTRSLHGLLQCLPGPG
ncbi:MAG: hypothetical protein ACOC84_01775 [Actinomycetota bacterium]